MININANILTSVLGRSGGGGFNLNFDGNILDEFDGKDATTITQVTNLVSQWAGKFGNIVLVNGGADSVKPLFNTDGVIFQNDWLEDASVISQTPLTLYYYFEKLSHAQNNTQFRLDNGSGRILALLDGTSGATFSDQYYDNAFVGTPVEPVRVEKNLIVICIDGANSYLRLNNGSKQTFTSSTAFTRVLLGTVDKSAQFAHVKIHNLTIRKIADTDETQTAIFNFFKTKYSYKNYQHSLTYCNLLFDGDSLFTAYNDTSGVTIPDLVNKYITSVNTKYYSNQAVAGQTSTQLLSNLQTHLDATYQPGYTNLFVMLIGANDLATAGNVNTLSANILSAVAAANAKGFNSLVCTLLPNQSTNISPGDWPRLHDEILAINTLIRNNADANNYDVIDLYNNTIFNNYDAPATYSVSPWMMYATDKIHYLQAGKHEIGKAILEFIKQNF